MNWDLVLKSFSVGFSGLALWFIYDLIKDFKEFKKEAGRDIGNLKKEREDFKLTVSRAELSIGYQVQEMKKVHGDFSLHTKGVLIETVKDLSLIKTSLSESAKKTEQIKGYLDKSLLLHRNFHERLKFMENDLKTLKIQIGDVLIIKDKK